MRLSTAAAIAAIVALSGCQGSGLSQTPEPVVPQTPGASVPGAMGSTAQPAAAEDSSADDGDAPVSSQGPVKASPSAHPSPKATKAAQQQVPSKKHAALAPAHHAKPKPKPKPKASPKPKPSASPG